MEDEGSYDDTLTVAMALGYAIASFERLPRDWRQEGEEKALGNMQELFGRIVPDRGLRDSFIEISRAMILGKERPFERPTLAIESR